MPFSRCFAGHSDFEMYLWDHPRVGGCGTLAKLLPALPGMQKTNHYPYRESRMFSHRKESIRREFGFYKLGVLSSSGKNRINCCVRCQNDNHNFLELREMADPH